MSLETPRVSIGLPVYNGENYLREALDSILAQTFPHFELIISDNASTDKTREICEAYVARDRRIRYYRYDKNIGLAGNFNRVLALSTGDFFKWAAHDDVIAHDFLAKCVAVLDRFPDVILCESKVRALSPESEIGSEFPMDVQKLSSPKRHVRFGYLLMTDRVAMGEYFGLIRSNVLRMNVMFRGYPGGENPVRVELGLRGQIHVIPEHLFFFRSHPEQSYRKHPAVNLDAAWFASENAGRILYPHWSRLRDYCRSVKRVPMNPMERLQCFLRIAQWVVTNLNWARLLLDPVWAFMPGLWRPYFRLKVWFLKKTGQTLYPSPK
jgi:glycosyltransferase involved in cell wall biosynthesis